MTFYPIDWLIVIVVTGVVIALAFYTRKYTKNVADFLAANRCAGRYMLCIALGEAGMGVVSFIAVFEIIYQSGLVRYYWGAVGIPLALFIQLSGWVIYRYRQTRSLTLAQFFERRYSRRFRIFAGSVAFFSGVLNYAVFPSISGRFFMRFCNLPSVPYQLGPFEIDLMLGLVMFILVGIAYMLTYSGGQIAVIVTDFWQGIFATLLFMVLLVFLWFKFPWEQIVEAMQIASPPGQSLFNPFDISGQADFNMVFYLITWFMGLYSVGAWQGTQGYQVSAITPHDAKMARVIGQLKGEFNMVVTLMIPLSAIVVMHHPAYSDMAASVSGYLVEAFPNNPALQTQMRVPAALNQILPPVLMGAFVAAMVGFFLSTDNTYMHSWGSIFVQDIVSPLRKKPLEPAQHLKYLRLSILAVAVFAWCFSLIFPLREYIHMFFSITASIYLGGAGSVIVGGLYWKRGTTAGAWAAMITGSSLSVTSVALRQAWPHIPALVEYSPELPINSVILTFYCALSAVIMYIVVSLLGKPHTVNMDKLLNRGVYANADEQAEIARHVADKPLSRFWRFIGVNGREFSRLDKGLFAYTFWYGISQIAIVIVLGILHFAGHMTTERWFIWWRINILWSLCIGIPATIWITIGGLIDIKAMYRRLRTIVRDDTDDGRVTEHLGDEAADVKAADKNNGG